MNCKYREFASIIQPPRNCIYGELLIQANDAPTHRNRSRERMAEEVYTALEKFKKGKDHGQTLENLDKYVKRAKLVFTTADVQGDDKKKSFLQIWGGDVMVTLFEHEGKVVAADTFDEAVKKIKDALTNSTN